MTTIYLDGFHDEGDDSLFIAEVPTVINNQSDLSFEFDDFLLTLRKEMFYGTSTR